jgi:long-chain acyl-CoA synthetase
MYNLASILEESVKQHPTKEAIVFGDMRLDYATVNIMANQVANVLQSKGIQPGDHVALTCPNLPYFPIIWMGILKAGAVMVPLSILLRPREIAYHLKDSDSKIYICFEGVPDMPMGPSGWEGYQQVEGCTEFITLPATPFGPTFIEGHPTLLDLMQEQPPSFDTIMRKPEDTCLIIYTSGTTGQPKGAELTHSNMVMNCTVAARLFTANPDDRTLIVLPLFHSFAMSILNITLLSHSTVVLLPRFDAGAVLDLFQKEKITTFAGVPTMYWEMINYDNSDGNIDMELIANTLRICSSGGAALPVEVLKNFEEKYNVCILEGYGLSETSPIATFNPMESERKVGSIGIPIWGVEMKIVDEDMNELPAGEEGEIVIRGHNVMKGYYKRPEASEECFRGGWFHSGDVGKIDEDGFFFIVDRVKDMIIRGGFNVYPREIEEVMMTHSDVSLVAVIGIPSDQHGEEIKAFIVPKEGSIPDIEEVKAWGKEQFAAYKYPRIIEVVSELPLGPTGKILKKELRAMDKAVRENS